MTLKSILIYLILTTCFFLGCRSTQTAEQGSRVLIASTERITNDLEAQHEILLAFAQGYPDIISGIEFINNDWTMLVNGKRFYFANGRFLPEELRGRWRNYIPYDFYTYPWTGTHNQRLEYINNPIYSVGSSFLFDAIYNSPTEDESWDLQEKYSFLGVKMLVHSYIVPKLDIISERIRAAARTDRTINPWIAELHTSTPSYGWNWRVIAGSNRRSNHSYGTAMDLLPVNLRGRLTYWLWNEDNSVPVNRNTYYMPPETVIRIFEEYGFIWGGSWALIDTMHFEYRPEILILNGFTVK